MGDGAVLTMATSYKALEPAVLSANEASDWHRVTTLLACVHDHPEQVWPFPAYLHLATALQHLGRLEEADGLYGVLRERWPDRSAGWWGRISVAKACEDWSAVVQGWRDFIARFPDQEVVGWRLGLIGALRRKGDVAAAREAAAALRERWPDDPAGWQVGAEIAVDLETAARNWQACLNRFPDLQEPLWWSRFAQVLHKLGRIAEAAEACATLRKRWPDDSSGWHLAAQFLSDTQDWPRAVKAWASCINRFPDLQNVSWWLGLALAQSRLGQINAAAQTRAAIQTRWPDHPSTWFDLALTSGRQGNWPKAARLWENCLNRFDLHKDALFIQRYSTALIRSGRIPEAAIWIAKLRAMDQQKKDWLALRLELLLAQGDARGALQELQDLSGHPAFSDAFPASKLTTVVFNAGLERDAAMLVLAPWIGADEAERQITASYDLQAPNVERLAAPDRQGRRIPARVDTPLEMRRRLRLLARERTITRFDAVVTSALLMLDREGLTRLLQLACRRFPASRSRILLETTLNRGTIPASEPDQVFAHRWRNVLPQPTISIAGQLAGRPWRRLVCAVMVCDEEELLPLFMDHYCKLGVGSFIIINNGSARHPSEVLTGCDAEITYVEAPFSFRAARHGMAWINEILELGLCDWLLFADSDELLIYPGGDEVKLPQLLDHFDRRGETAMTALMVDVFDSALVQGGTVSANPEDHTLFSANHNRNSGVFPRWQRRHDGYLAPGIVSHDPNKTPLVKASSGVRYTNNHNVTSCTPAETSGVFRHLKLLRDRELINKTMAEVMDHPRVRGRASYCVGRHVDMAGMGNESIFERSTIAEFSMERLLRLGYCLADPDWRARLPAPLPADRRTPAAALQHDPSIRFVPELVNIPLMNEPLPDVLAALEYLSKVANRDVFRRLLTAQLERIGLQEVACAMVLFAAAIWDRPKAVDRTMAATLRAIAKAGASVSVAALCEIADALAFKPNLALLLLNAVNQANPDDPEVARRRLNLLVAQGDRVASFGVLKGFTPSLEAGSVYNHLHLLAGVRDWAQHNDVMEELLNAPDLRANPMQLLRINVIPDISTRRHFLHKLLTRLEDGAQTGQFAVVYLSLLHLLGETTRLADVYNDFAPRLPAAEREYFRRLLAAQVGGPPVNRIWGVGLSKTGTTSMNDYCVSLGMLGAHWVNPVTRALLGSEDADLFDIVSDTSIVHLARVSGVPEGRRIITTTRDFNSWSKSFYSHFGSNLFMEQPATFDAMRDLLLSGEQFRFGAQWTEIHIELYFRFRNLREAYDYHTEWTQSFAKDNHPHLLLPLEMPDSEKAIKLSEFVGRPKAAKVYPHANQRK